MTLYTLTTEDGGGEVQLLSSIFEKEKKSMEDSKTE